MSEADDAKRWFIHEVDLRLNGGAENVFVANTAGLYVVARLQTLAGDVLVFAEEYVDGDGDDAEINITDFLSGAEADVRLAQLRILWGLDDELQINAADEVEVEKILAQSLVLPAAGILGAVRLLPNSN